MGSLPEYADRRFDRILGPEEGGGRLLQDCQNTGLHPHIHRAPIRRRHFERDSPLYDLTNPDERYDT